MRKIVSTNVGFVSVLSGSLLSGHLQFSVLPDEAAEGGDRFRAIPVAIKGDENLQQLALGWSWSFCRTAACDRTRSFPCGSKISTGFSTAFGFRRSRRITPPASSR